MTKHFFTLGLFIIFSLTITSQELPEIVPPSPQAFEMTKYGDVPINESSGMVTASIPIYNYTAGKLSLPISVNYTGSGVKVFALSSWTGINWTLNAGGVITRTVKDKPDEWSMGNRLLYDREDLDAMNLDPYSVSDLEFLTHLATNTPTDTQADAFSFNFSGYSGSFYLDENFEPKLANYETELDIEFQYGVIANSTTQTIIITDPNGTHYYFGGVNGVEQSNFHQGGATSSDTYPTSYYLYKIINGLDNINLEYTDIGQYTIYWGQVQSEERFKGLLYSETQPFCNAPPRPANGASDNQSTQQVFDGKFLSKITNNRTTEELRFNSASPAIPNFNFARQLHSIDHYANNSPGKRFEFEYLTDNNSTRFFLTEVRFSDNNQSNAYNYTLSYNDPLGLPPRVGSNSSYAQDFLGYYNGKSNTTLLPKDTPGFPGYGYADRSPDFSSSIKGALTKIEYPTGGSTAFEYEAPVSYKFPDVTKYLETYLNQDNYLPNTGLTDQISLYGPSPVIGEGIINEVGQNQTTTVQINASAEHLFTLKRCDIKVSLLDYTSGTAQTVSTQTFALSTTQDPTVDPNTTHSFSKNFSLTANKEYKVTIELIPDRNDPNAVIDNTIKILVNASFNILALTEVAVAELGIRVKQVTDQPQTGLPVIKYYHYKEIDKLDDHDDSNFTNGNPARIGSAAYIHNFQEQSCCIPGVGSSLTGFNLHSYTILSSDPLQSLLNNGFLSYPKVTVSYGNADFKNGGIEKTFYPQISSHQAPYSNFNLWGEYNKEYVLGFDNNNLYKGKVTREIIAKRIADKVYIDNETQYDYTLDNSEYATNMIITKTFICAETDRPIHEENKIYKVVNIGLYKTYSSKISLSTKTTRQYHDLIEITDKSQLASYDAQVTIQNYEYDSYAGQPTRITTTTSDNDKTIEIRNTYADQAGQLTGLTSAQISAYATLETLHRISSPIQTQRYQIKGTASPELMSTQRTLYKDWSGSGLVYPEYLQSSKDTDALENRIHFYGYTPYGDLVDVSKENGNRIRYMYNALSQVIRKIENYDPAILIPAIGTNATNASPCLYQNQHPNAMVTLFKYKDFTDLIEYIEDPRCRKTNYNYDSFDRLKSVKDHNNTVLSENQYHFTSQN